MNTVGLSVLLGADFSSAEEAMARFYASVQSLAKNVQTVFSNMGGTAASVANMFKPISDGAQNASKIAINESKARQQADNEETQAALNASRLRMQAKREEAQAQRAATQAKRAEKDEYAQLVAKNQALVREYYNASASLIRYGEASGITKEKLEQMAAAALAGQEQLKQIEAGAGRFQRNVGNYSGAMTFLNQSIAQISSEIPNFFQSLKIGFMSIGNNIGQVVQGVQLLRKENASLMAQGKQTQSVIGALAKSLFGWQTILFVGVGLITRYGASLIDWATGADKAKAKAEELKKQQDAWSQITESSNKTAADQIAKLELLNSTMTDGNLSMDKRIAAYNEAKKLYPSYLAHLDKDKALNVGIADVIDNQLVPAIMAAATARAYEGKISDIVTKNIELNEKKKVASYEKTRKETDYLIAKEKARANGNDYTVTPLGGVVRTSGNAELAHATRVYQEASDKVADFDAQIQNNNAHLEVLKNDMRVAMEATGALGVDGIDPLTHKTKQAKEKVDDLTKANSQFADSMDVLSKKIQLGYVTQLQAMQMHADAVKQHIEELFKAGANNADLARWIELLKMINFELNAIKSIDLNSLKGGGDSADQFHNSLEELERKRKENQDRAATLGDSIFKGIDLDKQRKRWESDTDDLEKRIKQFSTRTGRILGKTMDPFIDAIIDGKNAFDALGDSLKGVVADLIKAVAKAALLSAIGGKEYNKQTGGFTGILGGLLGIGLKAAIPFLADGGVVTKPTLAMIGESGPEAVQPLSKLGQYGGNQRLTLRTEWHGRVIKGATDTYNDWNSY